MHQTANATLIVDRQAMHRNVRALQNYWGSKRKLMVMLKSDGYGTGACALASFWEASGVDYLGLAFVDEARTLRQAGVSLELFVLHMQPKEASDVIGARLTPAVDSIEVIEALAALADTPVNVHLHVDTGMTRLGCSPGQAIVLAECIHRSPNLHLQGVFTHLPSADESEHDAFTSEQYQVLIQVLDQLRKKEIVPEIVHVANSAGSVRFPFPKCNLVRVGLAVYGLYSSEQLRSEIDLEPVVTLRTTIRHIHHVQKGATVGYGRNYRVCADKARIGVLPIGYADGLHRHYASTAYVALRETTATFAGSICMDFSMLDLSSIPDAAVGDSVTLFGYDESGRYHSPEAFAQQGATIVYELLTCLGPRVQRIYL